MVAPQPQRRASMEHWLSSIQAQMAIQREHLLARDPRMVAQNSGAYWQSSGADSGVLSLRFFGDPLRVHVPGYTVVSPEGQSVAPMIESLVITYLLRANGVPRAGEWIAFRELPDGMFYHRAFDGYSGQHLVRVFGDDLGAFQRGAASSGGTTLSALGDAAYEFCVLPNLWVAAIYWLGDEEDGFPSQARVLFDRAAEHYMIVDGLAIIGSQLTRRVIAAARM